MSFPFSADCCLICRVVFASELFKEQAVTVTQSGLNSLKTFCGIRGDCELNAYLDSNPSVVKVHASCRKRFTDKRSVNKSDESDHEEPLRKKLRSSVPLFNWKEQCFLCGEAAVVDPKHPETRTRIRQATTIEMRQNLLQRCAQRNDVWALQVRSRLETCSDLPAVEAIYHKKCHLSFTVVHEESPSGRVQMNAAFEKTCEWLENCAEDLYTVLDLHKVMTEFACNQDDVYSVSHFQRKLLQRYGDSLVISDVQGRRNVLCFQHMAKRIINDKWYADREMNTEEESHRIVTAAAKLLKASIRERQYDTVEYPLNAMLRDRQQVRDWMPDLLQAFLKILITDELKQIGIGHSLIQATRPRSVISPALFGVGVSVDHVLGSRWLLDLLSSLGLSISYSEVDRYKKSVVQASGTDQPPCFPDSFTQWAADNVDHNVATLDGLGTFHGMGIISMSTPNSVDMTLEAGTFGEVPVVRLPVEKVMSIIQDKGIPITYYSPPDVSSLKMLRFKPRVELLQQYTAPPSVYLDLVWHMGWFFRGESNPRPNWSGFMQDVTVGSHPSPADIRMLPIIDLNPNDRSCIYSTLRFIEKQADALNIPVPCLTFDQPLWLKAVEIVAAESMNIVCRLGGFHMLMSFLGSIGSVMAGSGISDALETCYGPNAVGHMMSGKAYARAVRGHLLVESALYTMLLHSVLDLDCDMSADSDYVSSSDVSELRELYDLIVNEKYNVDEEQQGEKPFEAGTSSAFSRPTFVKLQKIVEDRKVVLCRSSRTAKLWVQYLQYVTIVKTFIRAERTATGHSNYAKSARLYLQMMTELEVKHTWLYEQFTRCGYYTVRRSDRLWAGLSTDLTIEQVMMRSLKSRYGLTRGRGMTVGVRHQWVHSMHKCAGVHAALAALTGREHRSGEEQHTELGKSRASRDYKDLLKVMQWFADNNPFNTADCRLRSLSSGLVADDEKHDINCDNADEVGSLIMQKMDGMSFTDVTMKKTDQVKTLAHLENHIKVGKKEINIDSSMLFSRLLVIVERSGDMEPYFNYELTATPLSLFKNTCLRKTDKSSLAKVLMKRLGNNVSVDYAKQFVLDGGCLLHRVKWMQNVTYGDVFQQYVSYIRKHYGNNVVIVFDGYGNGPSIKDHEHQRRANKCTPDISLNETKPAHRNQAAFLLNEGNKATFVSLLMQKLLQADYKVLQSLSDADTLIVCTALEFANTGRPVTVVADDTDVLVLLIHHFRNDMADIFMLSEIAQRRSGRTLVMPIRNIYAAIGSSLASQLPTIHAVSGCDTTSAMYGFGKTCVLRKIEQSMYALQLLEQVGQVDGLQGTVTAAGSKLLTFIYGGKTDETLNHLRFVSYMNQVATSSVRPRPERLPPTEQAAYFHLLRVHLQVVIWKTLGDSNIKAEEWGWVLDNGRYNPVTTDLEAAPADILNVVRCRCKPENSKACSSKVCSCQTYGLHCVPACKNCYGELCNNVKPTTTMVSDSDNEDDADMNDEELMDDLEELVIPEECLEYEMPWIDEELV